MVWFAKTWLRARRINDPIYVVWCPETEENASRCQASGRGCRYVARMITIRGAGYAYAETGTEGVYWCIFDDQEGKTPFDRLHLLKDGDRLTVFDRSNTTSVRWSGVVHLEYESRKVASPFSRGFVAQAIFNQWCTGCRQALPPKPGHRSSSKSIRWYSSETVAEDRLFAMDLGAIVRNDVKGARRNGGTVLSIFKRIVDPFIWFFGTLLGAPSVIDRPLPRRRRRLTSRADVQRNHSDSK